MLEILTVKEVVERYRVGRYTVDAAIHCGALKAQRPNRRQFLIRSDDAEEWFQASQYDPPAKQPGLLKRKKVI